jgi:hypothetical protein
MVRISSFIHHRGHREHRNAGKRPLSRSDAEEKISSRRWRKEKFAI